jgi:hypothetical protein
MTSTIAHSENDIYESTTPVSLNLRHKMEVMVIIIYRPLYSKAAATGLEMEWAPVTIP